MPRKIHLFSAASIGAERIDFSKIHFTRKREPAMFIYSGYWHTWSRILGRRPDNPLYIVEVNLTPINQSWGKKQWDEHVAPIIVRCHGTARTPSDLVVDELPVDVLADMKANLGEELADRLITEDFMSQIDFSEYDKVCNGGAPLHLIRRPKEPSSHGPHR